MANTTVYYWGESAKNYYAKPRPIDDSPWDGDDIAGTRNGTTNEIAFTLDDSVTDGYWIFERAGSSPASSDTVVAEVPGPDATLTAILNRETAQVV